MNIFSLPDLTTCVQAARAAFRAALPGANAWLWPNNIGPSAKVVAGAQWSAYQRLDYVGSQSFALFAEKQYLDYHGGEYNLPRRLASPASGNIAVTTTGAASFAAGGQFQRGDGVLFAATSAASTASAATISVPVVGPAGLSSNTAEGSPMTIVSGLTGVGATGATAAVDSNGLTGGLDIEADGAPMTTDMGTYRGRILFRKRNPPQGGSPPDYVQWCTNVVGVTRVFIERNWAGPGTVRVFPIFDNTFAGGVPDSGHVAIVADYLAPFIPATAVPTIAAATARPIAIGIANLSPATAVAQAAVIAELTDMFQRLGRVAGGDTAVASMPYLASPFTFLADWIKGAVIDAAGVVGADVTVSDTPITAGNIPVLGTVTFS